MRNLLACTCLTPLALAVVPAAVQAETVVGTARTTPISTSTANNGAADSIRISNQGSVKTTGGTAVTADSTHAVTNEGTVQITGANDATGIGAADGAAGGITNASGARIIIDETYAAPDSDSDGDADGPFAQGGNRVGIRTAGTYSGNIVNAGEITIKGNQSAGIALGGKLTGNLTSSGTISVIGNDSAGVRAGEVTGDVRFTGTITAQGADAVGVDLAGDIGGALSFQGAITATGYRFPAPPTDPSRLDADDLLQGGGAVRIAGNVGGGILFDAAPRDANPNDADEDKDGAPDASEGSASIISVGYAPAVTIGAADRDISVGAVAGKGGHGLIVNGAITGNGAYGGVSGTGILIGGKGGQVNIAGGMTVNGAVSANAVGAEANAIRIAAGATVPVVNVTGSVIATGGGTDQAYSGAIVIDSGAHVFTIRNSGQIRATPGGTGYAGAIIDRSGEVDLVENSGVISASGPSLPSGHAIAIDLSANSRGAIVRQTVAAANTAAGAIGGDILFGSGNDLLDVADGTVVGNVRFGAGSNLMQLSGDAAYAGSTVFGSGNDTLTLSGTSLFVGSADFGGGADTLTLNGTSHFAGQIIGSQGLSVAVNGGTLALSNSGTVALAGLSVAGGGTIGIDIGENGPKTIYQVAGTASFAAGSRLSVRFDDIADAEGRHVFLRAAALEGVGNLATTENSLPFLFRGSLATTNTAGEVALDISRKNATELGLNRSQASAYDAVYAALSDDADIAASYLGITDGDQFRRTLSQMLPNHAGGLFESVTQGSRATARFLADPNAPYADMGKWGFWLQQVGWGTSKNLGDTAAYDITGWGASAGADAKLGDAGNLGFSLAYLHGKDGDGQVDNEVNANQYELALYWRLSTGRLRAHARGSYAFIKFDGSRNFVGQADDKPIERRAEADWNGGLWSVSGGASYEVGSGRFTLRPAALAEYYRLSEDGYTETGGGDAFDLIVDNRKSDELAVSGTIAAGLKFGGSEEDEGWLRAEIEGGRRQVVGGSLGDTTARFASGGDAFTLTPDSRTDGWLGRVRLIGGNPGFTIGGDFGAEEQQGKAAISIRASLGIRL